MSKKLKTDNASWPEIQDALGALHQCVKLESTQQAFVIVEYIVDILLEIEQAENDQHNKQG